MTDVVLTLRLGMQKRNLSRVGSVKLERDVRSDWEIKNLCKIGHELCPQVLRTEKHHLRFKQGVQNYERTEGGPISVHTTL